MDTEKYIEKEV